MAQIAGDHYTYTSERTGPAPRAMAALPAGPPRLVGRGDETARLLRVLEPGPARSPAASAVVVSAVSGLAGIGKTALALHTAHEAAVVRGWFPGGVLFVDLRGYDPQGKVTAEQALGGLLRALGIRGEDMPPTQEERAALYRSELARLADAGKPVLLVADNASTPDQVAPLLPARHEHRALVTSRDTLATLPARQLRLGQLPSADARDLITTTLIRSDPDDARLDRPSDALDEVVGSCGGLPLALKLAAARLTGDPGLPLATFAAELADSRTRLGSLHYDDDSVRTAFALSFRRLAPLPARLFRLLPLAPGADISTEAASALLGRPARGELADLARAALLSEEPVGSGRWRMHDLIRLFASGLAHEYSARQRARARKRLLRYYATTARSATRYLWGQAEGGTSGPFTSREEAIAWLEAERPNLVAATRMAAGGQINLAVDLTYGVSIFLHRWGYVDDNLAILSAVVPAAEAAGRTVWAAGLRNELALSLADAGRVAEGVEHLREAVRVWRRIVRRRAAAAPSLALVLANLAFWDESPERRRAAAEEAVAITRPLVKGNGLPPPDVELAGALDNLSRALADLGLHTEALAPAREGVEIRRRQVASAPGGYEALLADAVVNLAARLLATGETAGAIDHAHEGVALYRQLAAESPKGSGPDLANALGTLGLCRARAGQWEAAREAHAEATAVLTQLERPRPAPSLNLLTAALAEAPDDHESAEASAVHESGDSAERP
ncbi:tetratricopeptide repeat protein [Streptomyces melanogenes]|uniref:tetratricopeptide repeat protein n=1 Tax=Streptomyces melanogenes TaxID=67326 RepID=UPI00167CE5CD|nr:tetratricopeptide repeat protein [Streptomyces melanogenes]GGP55746.1 hypothetical protein GCM10010278_35790 [Streptomyces melanogenes]